MRPPGVGYLDTITPPDPAAGAGITIDLQRQRWVILHSVRVSLTTSATVASRFVSLDYVGRGGITMMRNAATALVTASTTGQVFQWDQQHSLSEWNPGTMVFAPLYPLPLPAGWQVQINVDSIDTTDQLSGCRVILERFYPFDQGELQPG